MGLYGHELSEDIRDKLSRKLLEAFADEWVAGYYYMLTAYSIQGPMSEVISKHFLEEAEEEINKHAKMIADRLEELGVELPRDFNKLYQVSVCKYPEIPTSPFDIDGWLIAAVKAEICAINTYKELYHLAHGVDPATEELAEELLRDEVRHRTDLVNLLSEEGLKRLENELNRE